MTQPPGFTHPSMPHHACKLKKALYGLKQAPRAWFSRLSAKLLELGFTGSKSNTSLFILNTSTVKVFVLVFVDDVLVTGSHEHAISTLIQQLQCDFAVKNPGELS